MNKNDEIMFILQEECAEVTQAISKCLRFGIDNYKPGKPKTNREHLAEEIGDLIAMIELCYDNDIVDPLQVKEAQHRKFDKLKKWSTIYEQTENI
jgi:NTP pyrophosphatase (non-canonical NTP hydrolase)